MPRSFGYAFMRSWATWKASFWSSLEGFIATRFSPGYFLSRSFMWAIHAFWLAAVSLAVMIATSPLGSPPRSLAIASTIAQPMSWAVAWLTKKSRASGSASASQVITRTPCPRAFLMAPATTLGSLGETAMTSTPLRVHFSIISACFSGEPSVGPS